MEKAHLLAVSAICCILTACGGNNAPKAVPAAGTFPEVHVPGVITDPQERISYMAAHFWDGLSIGKNYDSDQLESVFGTYASILGSVPYSEAESSLGDLPRPFSRRYQPSPENISMTRIPRCATKSCISCSRRVSLRANMYRKRREGHMPMMPESAG